MKGVRSEFGDRYIEAVEEIKRSNRFNRIKRDADFCRAVDILPQKLANVRSGKLDVSQVMLRDLHERLGVRLEWLMMGTGPMFESPEGRAGVRDRIIDVIENELLKLHGIPSIRQFFKNELYSATSYHNYKEGSTKEPPPVLKQLLTGKYHVNWDYILTGEGSKIGQNLSKEDLSKNDKPDKITLPNPEHHLQGVPEEREFSPQVITVSPDNEDAMVLIEQKVAASYFKGYADPEWVAERPVISFPFMPKGRTTRAFQAEGDSMQPWFHNGCIVLCQWVENKKFIKQGYVHVIVSKEEGMTVKRLYTRGDHYRLVSDNPLFKPLDVPEKLVSEIWEIKYAITSQFPPPDDLTAKVHVMEIEQVKQGVLLKQIAEKIGI